jgi:hypothetical protein
MGVLQLGTLGMLSTHASKLQILDYVLLTFALQDLERKVQSQMKGLYDMNGT